jgi:hypothetical protein
MGASGPFSEMDGAHVFMRLNMGTFMAYSTVQGNTEPIARKMWDSRPRLSGYNEDPGADRRGRLSHMTGFILSISFMK